MKNLRIGSSLPGTLGAFCARGWGLLGLLVLLGAGACTPLRDPDLPDPRQGPDDPQGRDAGQELVDASEGRRDAVDGGRGEGDGQTPSGCTPMAEVCDGVDNDCNPSTPDGVGDPLYGTICGDEGGDRCPSSYRCVEGSLTCTSSAPDEICFNGEDDDCDGETDEIGGTGQVRYYPDVDDDGYGSAAAAGMVFCATPGPSWVSNNDDCDDSTDEARPRPSYENCDSIDNDCDGNIDEFGTGTPCAASCRARTFEGHAYQFCDLQQSRNSARSTCESFGYRLVTITSASEQAFIDDNMLTGSDPPQDYWIGLTFDDEGVASWETDESVDYFRWAPTEPDGDECAIIRADGTGWHDVRCSGHVAEGLICETL